MDVVDVLVIGGGPAGMTAATIAAESGLKVALIDERPDAGGQIYRGLEEGPLRESSSLGPDYTKGRAIIDRFRRTNVAAFFNSSLWRIDADECPGRAAFSCCGQSRTIRFTRLILATGAMERPVAFPGWTLPGVMNVGAAQLLLKSSGVIPSGRVALLGNGPLLLLFSQQLMTMGVRISALLDTAPKINKLAVGLRHFKALIANRDKAMKGIGLLQALRQSKIPVYRNVSEISSVGRDQLSEIRFLADGQRRKLALDLLLIHEGVIPNTQLSRALGCEHVWNEKQACFIPATDNYGRSSNQNIFIVGDSASIRGADAAPASAQVAVATIMRDLGFPQANINSLLMPALRLRQREESFRPFIDELYPPRLAISRIADETIICRCEEVRAVTLREAVKDGAVGPAQAKAFTRCGMGPCQGRICGLRVSQLIAEETSASVAEVGSYNVRFPLKPVTLADMAALANNVADGDNHVH